ncbi:uncharacterized protein KD926_007215 [Aspergillus affinis]|uniref:uncharacterized protein n=1 Tax=Aspergillus affinis TaxID=1070780 RepID=UPI0022FDFF9B|nr:uncharacterized protein KD926_007215 [Aspergillus affinis]KAI9041261.1 hypothetical protein KD926_007215 [Aspergillus affinis]
MSSSIMRITPMAARLAARSSVRSTTTPSLAVGLNRSISSTARMEKGPVEATKDTLKKADSAISGAAVKGIEKGQEATEKLKQTTGTAQSKSQELKGEAQDAAGKGKGKAEETLGQAKGKAEETLGEAKGKAKETLG